MSTVLAVTDLTSASYRLVGFAAFVAGVPDGKVVLISTYGGRARGRSEPPSDRPGTIAWRARTEDQQRREGELLERQRQWCADRGVRCQAELHEDGQWPGAVIQGAVRAGADLILVGIQQVADNSEVPPHEVRILARDAPCPVSVVRLPPLSNYF